ncbi:hypothetical protein [Acinetobacter modestus]|uniref:hypothetical protein n=1 Tax=Acinetobacter modestus TaxID=1776740 RepID=UPI00320A8290
MIKCSMSFECPKKWAELNSTDSAGVKFCSQCHSNVYWACNQNEFDALAKDGKCVAFEFNGFGVLGFPDGWIEYKLLITQQKLSAKQLSLLKSNFYQTLSFIEIKELHASKDLVIIETGSYEDVSKFSELLLNCGINNRIISQEMDSP